MYFSLKVFWASCSCTANKGLNFDAQTNSGVLTLRLTKFYPSSPESMVCLPQAPDDLHT